MQAIECPHCGRVGSLKTPVTAGTKTVRCPGCREVFEVGPLADPPIDLGIDLGDDPFAPEAATWGKAAPTPPPTDDRGIDLGDPEFDPSGLQPATAPASPTPSQPQPSASMTTPAVAPLARQLPIEPWFYGWLDWVAGLLWVSVVVILTLDGFGAFVALMMTFAGPSGGFNPSGLVALFWMVVVVPLSLVPVVTSSALIRLAVDVARHIRFLAFKALDPE